MTNNKEHDWNILMHENIDLASELIRGKNSKERFKVNKSVHVA